MERNQQDRHDPREQESQKGAGRQGSEQHGSSGIERERTDRDQQSGIERQGGYGSDRDQSRDREGGMQGSPRENEEQGNRERQGSQSEL